MAERIITFAFSFVCPSTETWGLHIQNKLLVKCLQVDGGRVSLGDCSPNSALQEWRWLPGSRALRNHHTGECLTAPREQYEGVQLQPCVFRPEGVQTDTGGDVADTGREASGQAWFCSKRGHLTLVGRGLHLSATQESTLVFLSREHKQVTMLLRNRGSFSDSTLIRLLRNREDKCCWMFLLNNDDKMSNLLFTSLAAGGEHLTTRPCAMAETTNTNLTTIWRNRWRLGFFKVPSLT